MITLYLHEQGSSIRLIGKRLKVVKGDTILDVIHLRDLERIVLYGNVELSAPAMAAILDGGIETVLLSFGGRFRGRLQPAESKNIFIKMAQFRRYDDMDFRMCIAETIVDAKIRNSRFILQRYNRNHPDENIADAIKNMDDCRKSLKARKSIAELMGAEGEAAKIYFSVFGRMVRTEFTFLNRSRRPPKDPVNALLSFGYTLLCTEMAGALAGQGLDMQVGFFHEMEYGRPSLALDLVEEFRQPVIDRLVLSIINRRVLVNNDFDNRGEAGVFLNEKGRKRFFEFYHQTLQSKFVNREYGAEEKPSTYGDLFNRQAFRMKETILGNSDYQPYVFY